MNYTVDYEDIKISIDSRNLKSNIIYDGDSFNVLVSGKGNIYDINGDFNIDNYKVIKKIEKAWNKQANRDLKNIIFKLQKKYKADILGFGNQIYKNNPKYWDVVKNDWNNKYFPNVKVKVETSLKISSAGSLSKTIRMGAK